MSILLPPGWSRNPPSSFSLDIPQERIILPRCRGRGCRDAWWDGGLCSVPPSPHSPIRGYPLLRCAALVDHGTGLQRLSHAGSPEMGK